VWATTIGAVAGAAPRRSRRASRCQQFGIPTLAAPYFFSALLFVITGYRGVRPAPPRPCAGSPERRCADGGAHRSLRAGLQAIIARAPAVLGVTAMAVGHMVMVGIMAMTPVHIRGAGHDAAHTLRIVEWSSACTSRGCTPLRPSSAG